MQGGPETGDPYKLCGLWKIKALPTRKASSTGNDGCYRNTPRKTPKPVTFIVWPLNPWPHTGGPRHRG